VSLTLVLGGTRSGKSAHAETLASATGRPVRYIATADASDISMAGRIALHQQRRPAAWQTVQATAALADAVSPGQLALIDGLGVWIAGHDRRTVQTGIAALISAAEEAEVIVVAEQAGDGLAPMDAVARDWLDLLGESVQRLSAAADRAVLVVAGRVIELPPVELPPVEPPPVELPPVEVNGR
jgi:adenosyl cobinamide kinase/adenosyl cobinamide phosphate guanylyltransferase